MIINTTIVSYDPTDRGNRLIRKLYADQNYDGLMNL